MAKPNIDDDDEEIFLDLLYKHHPDIFNEMFYEGAYGEDVIEDLFQSYPMIYRRILRMMD